MCPTGVASAGARPPGVSMTESRLAFAIALALLAPGLVTAGPESLVPHGPVLEPPADTSGAGFGAAVAALGDVNGDGYGDVAVGAPYDGPGLVHVYLGREVGRGLRDASPDLTLAGELTGDQFGAAIAPLGDVDGDGRDDFAVGAPLAADLPGHASRAGRAYVFLSGGLATATGAASANLTLAGAATDDRVGAALAGGGDFDGDGVPDLLVGAPLSAGGRGAVHLVSGSLRGAHAVAAAAAATLLGDADPDELGGGGLAFIDGAWAAGAPKGGADDAGRVYLFTGNPGDGAASERAARVWTGNSPGDHFGASLATYVTPGGRTLLAAGAFGSDTDTPDSGRVYLIDPAAASGDATAAAATVVDGLRAGSFGASLAAGDFDDDGVTDLLVGAPLARSGGWGPGVATLLPGPVPAGRVDAAEVGARIAGDRHSGRFGSAVAVVDRPDALHPAALLVAQPRLARSVHLLVNLPPSAHFDAVTVPCTGPTTNVTLDGSESFDPDGEADLYAHRWRLLDAPPRELGEGAVLNASLPPGAYDVALDVVDVYLASDRLTRDVIVYDEEPPNVTLRNPDRGHVYVLGQDVLLGNTLPFARWATVVGPLTVDADARDRCSPIDRVEFFLDDDLVHVDDEPPFRYEYDPSEMLPVFNRFRVRAYDAWENAAEDCAPLLGPGVAAALPDGSVRVPAPPGFLSASEPCGEPFLTTRR